MAWNYLKKIKHTNKTLRTILITAFTIDDTMFKDYIKKKIVNAYFQKPVRIYDLINEVNTQLHYFETKK